MKPYKDCRVNGPYFRPDGRQHVVVSYPNGTKSTVSYPKYLYEVHYGIYIKIDEIIHHKDGNIDNNSIENLEVVKRSIHGKNHHSKGEQQEFSCLKCGKQIILTRLQANGLRGNISKGKYGPYCKNCRPVNQYG